MKFLHRLVFLAIVAATACSSPVGSSLRRDARAVAGLSFDAGATLDAHPSEALRIAISTFGANHVRVWLEGAYGDASLSDNELTAASGRAEFTLTASSTVTDFHIVARATGLGEAVLAVHMTSGNTGTVQLIATYSGVRSIEPIVASVVAGHRCADAGATPDSKSARVATGFVNEKLAIANVPAGQPLAISARIAHYASGCIDVDPIAAGSARDASIVLRDVPISLDAARFDVTLAFDDANAADAAAWSRALDNAIAAALVALVRGKHDEAKALLDEMQTVAPSDVARGEFDAARARDGWDGAATTSLKRLRYSMRDIVMTWMTDGKLRASGPLRGMVSSLPNGGGAELSVRAFGRLTASDVLAATTVPAQWAVGSRDRLQLSSALVFNTNALVLAAANLEAVREPPHASTGYEALAHTIDCPKFAAAIVGGGVSYSRCDVTCTADLCKRAIASLWENMRAPAAQPSVQPALQLTISAYAHVEIDDSAHPTAFQGQWVADVKSSGTPFALRGAIQARAIDR